MITIPSLPLDEYVAALIGSHPFAVIDDKQFDFIKASVGGDYKIICVVENHEWTIGYDNQQLKQLRAGLWRCWLVRDWETADNRRRESLKKNDELQTAYKLKLERVVQHYISMGMVEVGARQIVAMMSSEMIEQVTRTIPSVTESAQRSGAS